MGWSVPPRHLPYTKPRVETDRGGAGVGASGKCAVSVEDGRCSGGSVGTLARACHADRRDVVQGQQHWRRRRQEDRRQPRPQHVAADIGLAVSHALFSCDAVHTPPTHDEACESGLWERRVERGRETVREGVDMSKDR